MKVILVTSVPAFPATAGNRSRIRGLADAIQRLGHELVFVQLPVSPRRSYIDQAAHKAAYGSENFVLIDNGGLFGTAIYQLRRKFRIQIKRLLVTLGFNDAHYHGLDTEFYPSWFAKLEKVGEDADVAIVEYVFNSRALEAFPASVRKIIDTHDAFAERHRRYLALGMQSGYWISLRRRDETRGFCRADTILAIQQEEAESFADQLASVPDENIPEVAVVSHFLNIESAPLSDFSASNTGMYLASDNPSNRKSIEWFLKVVLPMIVKERPDFRLQLVGTICGAVPETPNVVRLGRVSDLREAFRNAPLLINPTLVGTGINIKLLDAMAIGVPTVSTRTGVRGLPESYRRGIVEVVDDAPETFAAEILHLSSNPTLRAEMGQAAYEAVKLWNAIQTAELERCLTGEKISTANTKSH